MNFFTDSNTEGFTAQELAQLNARVAELLVHLDAPDEQEISWACDQANNEFTRAMNSDDSAY